MTVSELKRATNAAIDARRLLDAEFEQISQTFNIPAIELAFLPIDEVFDFHEIAGDTTQLIEQIELLRRRYKIVTDIIDRYRKRIDELSESQKRAVTSTSQLGVQLATIEAEIQRVSRELQDATNVDDIRRLTEQQISLIRNRASVELSIEREGEKDRNKIKAAAIGIEARQAEQIAQLQKRSQDRITKIESDAAEERTNRVIRYLNFEEAALRAREEAYALTEKRVTDNLKAEIQERERIREIALESGRELQERLSIFSEFDRSFGVERGPDQLGEALRQARELAEIQERFGENRFGFNQFREQFDLSELIPSGDPTSILRVYDAYKEAFLRAARESARDFEDRIGQAIPQFQDRVNENILEGAERAREGLQTNSDDFARYQRRVLREMRRDARDWANTITTLVDDVAISRTRSIREALTEFLKASALRIIQEQLEFEIFKYYQQKRREEIAKTAAAQALATGVGAAATGVLGASASANPVIATGIAAAQVVSVFLKIGSNEARDISNYQDDLRAENRL